MSSFTTVTEALQLHAKVLPERPAFIFYDCNGGRQVLTFEVIYRLGGRWAAVLKSLGLGRGDFVVSTLPNSPERVVCEAGILLSGAVSVNGQSQLADGSDILHGLDKSQATAIIVDPDAISSPWNALKNHLQLTGENQVVSSKLRYLRKVLFVKRREKGAEDDFMSHLETLEEWFHANDITEDDICTVFTTSGSTGFSKLVVCTHGVLVGYARNSNDFSEGAPECPKELSISPLGWTGGYAGHTFISATPRVLFDMRAGLPSSIADLIDRTIHEENCDSALIAPGYVLQIFSKWKRILKDEQGPSFSSNWKLKRLFLSGQPMTKHVFEAATALSEKVFVVYGGTDIGAVSILVLDDTSEFRDFDCGYPFTGRKVKVVSMEDEETELATDESGYITVKHPKTSLCYLNDPDATKAALTAEGYIRTGDIGKLTSDGHLFVEGRGSDAISRGMYIFYPGWLEARIRGCPGVLEAVVVGVPDSAVGEELCACLTLESDDVTMQSVREFVERDIVTSIDDPLSPRPRYYLKFDSFPLTSTDKTFRRIVRREATARLLG